MIECYGAEDKDIICHSQGRENEKGTQLENVCSRNRRGLLTVDKELDKKVYWIDPNKEVGSLPCSIHWLYSARLLDPFFLACPRK